MPLHNHLRRLNAVAFLAVVALTSSCGVDTDPAEKNVPAAADQQKKVADMSVKADLKNLATAMETYYVDSRTYPANVAKIAKDGYDRITLTKGTVAEVAVSADGESYCLLGWNPEGNHTEDSPLYYDSTGGGLVEEATGLCADEDAEFTRVKPSR